MRVILFLSCLVCAACQPPAAPEPQAITRPGLTIPGPYAHSPVVPVQADSEAHPSGGIYLKNSDHSATMMENIVKQQQY